MQVDGGFPHFSVIGCLLLVYRGQRAELFFCGTCDSSFKSFTRTEITARVKPYITMERRTGERYMINRFAPGIKMRPSRMK